MRENWKRICEARLEYLNDRARGGRFMLWNESNVKRIYYQAEGESGYSQFGSGYTSWTELSSFLDGVRETLFGIEYGTISPPKDLV